MYVHILIFTVPNRISPSLNIILYSSSTKKRREGKEKALTSRCIKYEKKIYKGLVRDCFR